MKLFKNILNNTDTAKKIHYYHTNMNILAFQVDIT